MVSFSLVARNNGFKAEGRFDVLLAASAPANVGLVQATPETLPAAGGTVVVTGTVEHAASCHLELLSAQSFPVVYSQAPRSCTSGIFTARVTIGANPSPISRTVSFALVAANGSSSFTGRFGVTLSAPPPPTTTTTATTSAPSASLGITTGSTPDGSVGVFYTFNLRASGGDPPYSWTVANGLLPTGLSISVQGTISGTPTEPGDYAFEAEVADFAGGDATSEFDISIGGESTTNTTTVRLASTSTTPTGSGRRTAPRSASSTTCSPTSPNSV
jgi:hypothetical protein